MKKIVYYVFKMPEIYVVWYPVDSITRFSRNIAIGDTTKKKVLYHCALTINFYVAFKNGKFQKLCIISVILSNIGDI